MGWLFSGAKINKIDINELKMNYLKHKNGKYFVDVRTQSEYKQKSIPGFVNLPLQTMQNQLNNVPKDKEIVVICQSGMRSAMACKILKKAGYEQVTNVRGGMNRW